MKLMCFICFCATRLILFPTIRYSIIINCISIGSSSPASAPHLKQKGDKYRVYVHATEFHIRCCATRLIAFSPIPYTAMFTPTSNDAHPTFFSLSHPIAHIACHTPRAPSVTTVEPPPPSTVLPPLPYLAVRAVQLVRQALQLVLQLQWHA